MRSKAASGDLTLLWALLFASLATKLALAIRFDGFLSGDDLEVVQSALRWATGYEYAPWSLRSQFHPVVLVAPLLRVAALFEEVSPELATFLATVPTALASTASILLVAVLAGRLGLSPTVGVAAALLYAVHWLPWAYGSTAYPRPISTALFLVALLIVDERNRNAVRELAAGILVAAACAIRFSEGVLLVPLLGFAWFRSRDWRAIVGIGLGFVVGGAFFLGLFDTWTWERPFSSLREFVRIMRGESLPPSATGDKPWFHYAANLFRWVSPLSLVLVAFALRDRRARVSFAMITTIVVLMSAFRYKQYRYLQAAIPFVAIAAAIGWDRLRAKAPPVAAASLALAVGVGALQTVRLLRDKSQSAVAAARYIGALTPVPRRVALEQSWAYGERLYLPHATIRDVPPARPLGAAAVREAVSGADAAAFYLNDLDDATRRALSGSGMRSDRSFRRDGGKPVVVFLRRP